MSVTTSQIIALDNKNSFHIVLSIFILILAIHIYAVVDLIKFWLNSEEYGHGLALVAIAGALLWHRRHYICRCDGNGHWIGLFVALAAQLLAIAGILADIDLAHYYAIWLMMVAVPISLGNKEFLKPFIFPLLIVLVSFPLPYLINKLLTTQMQYLSSDIGVWLIRLMGMPVIQDGNTIDMGKFVMLVEEACSGLRYLYPLLCISLILACFYRGKFWQKLIILVAAVPITILMNSFRIAMIGWAIKNHGPEVAQGFLHGFEGWVVFMIALAILIALIAIISLFNGKKGFVIHHFDFSLYTSTEKPMLPLVFNSKLFLLLAILVLGGATSIALALTEKGVIPERTTFHEFPMKIGERELFPDKLSPAVLDVLKADDYFIGDYLANGSAPINLFMAYYASQREGSVIHSPKDCLPGGGWKIMSLTSVDLATTGLTGQSNRALIRKGEDILLVYFWINQQGTNYASELMARSTLLFRSITTGRTDATLIRVIVPLNKLTEAQADKQIKTFLSGLSIELKRFLPE